VIRGTPRYLTGRALCWIPRKVVIEDCNSTYMLERYREFLEGLMLRLESPAKVSRNVFRISTNI
jgi:hypothetical protein